MVKKTSHSKTSGKAAGRITGSIKPVNRTPNEADRASSPARKLEHLKLIEIIDQKTIQPILEDMARITNTNVGIVDLNGKTIYATGWQEICTKFHRRHPETLKNCEESDKALYVDADYGTINIYKCKNKLQDVSTPIKIADKHFGSLVIGQFLFDDEPLDYEFFRSQARRCKFNEQEYMAALDKVPRYSKEKICSIMGFYTRLVNLISNLNISNIELTDSLSERNKLLSSLQLSEEKYRLLVENLHEGILRIDQDLCILFANKQMTAMLGYKINEILGKHLSTFIEGRDIKYNEIYTKIVQKSIKEPQDIEFIRKDGSRLYAILSTTPVLGADKEHKGAILGVQDITERKIAEQALADEAIRHRILIEQSRDGIVVLDGEGKVYESNKRFAEMLGYSMNEIGRLHVWDWDAAATRDRLKEMISTVNETGDHFETIHRRKDGTTYPVEISTNGAMVSGQKLIFCVCRDISARKQAEQALHDSEAKLKSIFDTAPVGIGITSNQVLNDMNKQMCEITGYSREELLGKSIRILYDSDESYEAARNDITRQLMQKGKATLEQTAVRKDGKLRRVLLNLVPVNPTDPASDTISTIVDITERKQTEEALKRSEAKLKSIYDTAPVGIVITINRVFTDVNNALCNMIGYTKQELIGASSRILYESDETYHAVGGELDKKILQQGVGTVETRYKHKDGRLIDVLINGTVINYDIATSARVFTVIDITEQKQMEKALRDNAEQLENIIGRLQTGILIIDAETRRITDVNQAAIEMIGSTRENIVGQICHKFMCSAEKGKCPITDLGEVFDRSERTLIRENGETVPILKSVTLFTYKGREHLIENFINITERKRIEEERQRVEKLESIGLLAGGIAHDFNNILTGIMGNISLAKIIADPESDVYEIMQDAEKASLKAKDLTQQLLTFSKGGAPVKKTTSIADLIKHTATFALRGSNVRCDFSIPDELWNSEIDEGQISQVINNLIINAQQSMPGGGTIELIAENVNSNDKKYLDKGMPLDQAKYVRITIKDHGTGIPPEHLVRIFDPFFTTKQKGSGLGLATSYSIIRRHNGYISVDSKLGSGSTFYVYLPATDSKTPATLEESKPVQANGGGRLLIMDDEQIVRDVAKRILNHMGYEDIDFALDGEEAIVLYEKAKKGGKPYAMVILDLTIPGGMGGEETIKKLKEIDPHINAIVSSGYSNEPVMSHFGKYGFKGAVTKPYTLEQLVKILR